MKTDGVILAEACSPKPSTRKPQQQAMAWLCGLIYVLAAVPKLLEPVAFYRSVLAYRLVPEGPAWVLAHTLPWLELMAGLALVAPSASCRRAGAGWVAVLSVVFLLALASVGARGMDISCGCFGTGAGWWNSVPVAMAKNAVLLVAAKRILTTNGH
jgi:hypothetical protein